jgi:hypothetical protein
MKRFGMVGLLAMLAALVSVSPPAQAQLSTQLYTSPGGSGSSCSGSAPCQVSEALLNHLSGGFEVSCIGGGFFRGNLLLSGSIIIDCPGGVFTSDGAPFEINGPSGQVVIFRNMTFEGAGQSGAPFILVDGGATVIVENCKFQNLGNHNAVAVQFQPSSVAAQLVIRDSVFLNNGIAPSSGGGLQVVPAAGGTASVTLERVSFNYNVTAMALAGPVNVLMINSTVSASRSNGILVGSGSTLEIKDSTLAFNVGAAVNVSSGGTLHLSNNDIKSNQIGIRNTGGQALSYRNNRISGNGSTATLGTIAGGQ